MSALREPKLLKLEIQASQIMFCILRAQPAYCQIYAIVATGI